MPELSGLSAMRARSDDGKDNMSQKPSEEPNSFLVHGHATKSDLS